jgi:phospholipase/carboxylesterase
MLPVTELVQSQAGLTYRLRRGQPHGGLIVMLHGLSGDEDVMWIFDHALPRSAAVIAPRALYASELGGYSWTRAAVRDQLDQVDFQDATAYLARFMREVTAVYQVDPQRVIVMGFSQGAALSYAFSLEHPAMLCGVIALAGFLPPHNRHSQRTCAAHSVVQVPTPLRSAQNAFPRYLIVHGAHDEAVPIERAREARLVLESRGASVEYHEHRVGHKVSAQGMQEIKHWIDKTWQEC